MKLVPEAVAELVAFKAEAEDTMAEEADAFEEEGMTAVVDVEADMAGAAGIIQVIDGSDRMQEWYSIMMAYI